MKQIEKETSPAFRPTINPRSRQLDNSKFQNFNDSAYEPPGSRTERMYNYQKIYEENRAQLQNEYKDKDIQGMNFRPNINSNS